MENVSTCDNGRKINLCKLQFKVTSERGFEIILQSNHKFDFLADKRKETYKLGGIDCYFPRNGDRSNLAGVPGFFTTEKNSFQFENFLNLGMLLAKDLQKGVTFNFGSFPIGKDKIEEYASGWIIQLKCLYLAYMKPVNFSVNVTTETVECERHD